MKRRRRRVRIPIVSSPARALEIYGRGERGERILWHIYTLLSGSQVIRNALNMRTKCAFYVRAVPRAFYLWTLRVEKMRSHPFYWRYVDNCKVTRGKHNFALRIILSRLVVKRNLRYRREERREKSQLPRYFLLTTAESRQRNSFSCRVSVKETPTL